MSKMINLAGIEIPTEDKKLATFIDNAVIAYGNGKVRIHCAAVAALCHAAEFGNAIMMNRLYSKLHAFDPKEASKLRVWIGETATYETDSESGVITKQWAAFSKEKFETKAEAFFVKTGLSDERTATLGKRTAILNGRRFYQAADKDNNTMTLEKILEALSRIEKTTNTKADKIENGETLPTDIASMLKDLAKAATVAKAALH